jgi:hypothetical protein
VIAVTPGSRRISLAVLCALALLLPVLSALDDFNSTTSFDDIATLSVAIVAAFLLVAVSRVHGVTGPAYAIAIATPSDPRSPPR